MTRNKEIQYLTLIFLRGSKWYTITPQTTQKIIKKWVL